MVQGERELVKDCRSLARFELRGIPPMVAGAARVRVTFQVDADGLLSVSAREMSTGVESHIQVKPSYGLTDEEVARMLQDSYAHAQEDMAARQLAEARVDGWRLVEASRSALAQDGEALLTPEERGDIETMIAALETALAGEDLKAIRAASDALNKGTVEFAARRMDASVRKALKGHRLEELDV